MVPLAGLIGIRKDPGILTIGGTPGTWHQLHSQKIKMLVCLYLPKTAFLMPLKRLRVKQNHKIAETFHKVRTVGLNVIYLLMLNKDVTKHMSTHECAGSSERGIP
jgi:hypothetical protein